jgi:hypothetical protein
MTHLDRDKIWKHWRWRLSASDWFTVMLTVCTQLSHDRWKYCSSSSCFHTHPSRAWWSPPPLGHRRNALCVGIIADFIIAADRQSGCSISVPRPMFSFPSWIWSALIERPCSDDVDAGANDIRLDDATGGYGSHGRRTMPGIAADHDQSGCSILLAQFPCFPSAWWNLGVKMETCRCNSEPF